MRTFLEHPTLENQECKYECLQNLGIRLINKQRNKDILRYLPHITKFQNLAVIFVIEFRDGFVKVDYDKMHALGFENVEDMYKIAKKNSAKRHPVYFSLLKDIEDAQNTDFVNKHPNLPEKGMDEDTVILISNKDRLYGATVILYNNVIQSIYNYLGDFVLYPCNVHELIAVPFPKEKDRSMLLMHSAFLSEMNSNINKHEILSDVVYLYQDGVMHTCFLSIN